MNIGGALRALDRALDHPEADDRQRARGARHHDVEASELLRQFRSLIELAVEAVRQRLRALERAIGNGDRLRVAAQRNAWRRARSFRRRRRTARARRPGCRRCAAPRAPRRQPSTPTARRSRSCCALPWPPRRCAGTGDCSSRPSAAGAARQLLGLLHLTEDLRLAQHHRVEAAGDAERVTHGVSPAAARRSALQFVQVQLLFGGDERRSAICARVRFVSTAQYSSVRLQVEMMAASEI